MIRKICILSLIVTVAFLLKLPQSSFASIALEATLASPIDPSFARFVEDVQTLVDAAGVYRTTGPDEEDFPYVYVIPGNPDLETIILFSKEFVSIEDQFSRIPWLILFNERGSGTTRLIEETIAYYYPEGVDDATRSLEWLRGALEDFNVTEAQVIEFILAREEPDLWVNTKYLVASSGLNGGPFETFSYSDFRKTIEVQGDSPVVNFRSGLMTHVRIVTSSELVYLQFLEALKVFQEDIGYQYHFSTSAPSRREIRSMGLREIAQVLQNIEEHPEDLISHLNIEGVTKADFSEISAAWDRLAANAFLAKVLSAAEEGDDADAALDRLQESVGRVSLMPLPHQVVNPEIYKSA